MAVMDLSSIPLKLYYSIGDVSKIAAVEPHVLRYWETEFRNISPVKDESGRRRYRRKDIEIILMIKNLLYEKKYTIAGAKQHFDEMRKSSKGLFDDLGGEEAAPAAVQSALPSAAPKAHMPMARKARPADAAALERVNTELHSLQKKIKAYVAELD